MALSAFHRRPAHLSCHAHPSNPGRSFPPTDSPIAWQSLTRNAPFSQVAMARRSVDPVERRPEWIELASRRICWPGSKSSAAANSWTRPRPPSSKARMS